MESSETATLFLEGVCFFLAFDLKVLIDLPLSFFQFFVISCAGLRAFFFFPHTD